MSEVERKAEREGRSITATGAADLTDENYRDFMSQTIMKVLQDDRVCDIASAQKIAPEYGLSISLRKRRDREHVSYALLDEKGAVLRVPKRGSSGTVKAALAGSRLDDNFRLEGITAFIASRQAHLADVKALQDRISRNRAELDELDELESNVGKDENAETISIIPGEQDRDADDTRPPGSRTARHQRTPNEVGQDVAGHGERAQGANGDSRNEPEKTDERLAELQEVVEQRRDRSDRLQRDAKRVADSIRHLRAEADISLSSGDGADYELDDSREGGGERAGRGDEPSRGDGGDRRDGADNSRAIDDGTGRNSADVGKGVGGSDRDQPGADDSHPDICD